MRSAPSAAGTATRTPPRWIEELRELASRTGMREFTLRSLLHGAALGNAGDAAAAELLAAERPPTARWTD